jgi:phage-related protein
LKLFSIFGELLLKDTASANIDKVGEKARGLSGVFESSFGKIGSLALKLGGIIGLGFGIKELATKGYELAESASDLSEAQNVVEQTYKSSSKAIEAWTQTTAKSAGISQTASTQWVGFMGAMLKSSGVTEQKSGDMSKSLVQLTGDMSSFYNVGTSDMWEKIRSGISGETEPLKALGINMSVANLQAFALAEGIKKPYDKMSQSEQTILRYNYLMNVTKDAQGDFGRTLSTSFANQVRVAQMNFETLGRNIGTMLLPAFNNAVMWFNSNMPKIQDVIQKSITGAGNAIKTLSPIVSGIIKDIMQIATNLMPKLSGSSGDLGKNLLDLAKGGLTTLKDILDWIAQHGEATRIVVTGIASAFMTWKTIQTVVGTVNNVRNAISTVTTTISNVKDKIDTARIAFMYLQDGVLSVSTRISNFGSSVLNTLGSGLTKIGGLAKSGASALLDFGKAAAQGAINLAKMTLELGKQAIAWIAQKAQMVLSTVATGAQTIAQYALNLAMSLNPITIVIIAIGALVAALVLLYNKNEWFRNGVNSVFSFVKSFIMGAINAIIGFFHNLVSGVESAGNGIRNAFNSVVNWFSSLPSRFVQFGSNMINGLRNGISSVMGTIGGVISSGFNGAIGFITSLPGRALNWGRDFINGLKNGIMSGIGGIINAVSGVADKIRSFLHFSVPDEGSLTDYESWMPDFMGGLANGIDKNKYKVTDAIKGLSTDMSVGMKLNSNNIAGSKIEGSANVNTANNNKPKQPYIHQTILNSRVIAQETYEDISELQEKKTQQDGRNIGYDPAWSNV